MNLYTHLSLRRIVPRIRACVVQSEGAGQKATVLDTKFSVVSKDRDLDLFTYNIILSNKYIKNSPIAIQIR
jgi:hypothetical protein